MKPEVWELTRNYRGFVVFCFLFLACQLVWVMNSYSDDSHDTQILEFNTGYKALIGDRVYTVKTDDSTSKKNYGTISGIKKNRDNTIYMLIEFQEGALPGDPVFFEDKIVGMVYRQSTAGELYEAMPVKMMLDFMRNINISVTGVKASEEGARERRTGDKISEVKKYIEARNYDKATKVLQEEMEKEPENAELHGWMGIAMMETGNPRQAAAEFRKAIKIEPANADFHNGLGYAMLAMGSFDEAITSFKEAIRINPVHADAHYGIGTAYINTGKVKLATKEYMILKDINEKMSDGLFKLIIRSGGFETE